MTVSLIEGKFSTSFSPSPDHERQVGHSVLNHFAGDAPSDVANF
jgi:hypothetical protein